MLFGPHLGQRPKSDRNHRGTLYVPRHGESQRLWARAT